MRIAGQVSEMMQWKHKAVIQGEDTSEDIHISKPTRREQLRNLELGWWVNWEGQAPKKKALLWVGTTPVTQYKHYLASTEKNWEESRSGGSQSSLHHQSVDCLPTETGKISQIWGKSQIPFVSPVAHGWLELQAAFSVIVCWCFVCKSENCSNISYTQGKFSREK